MLPTKKQTMSSREIADFIGKKHAHVMRDIREMEEAWVNIGQSKFGSTYYTDQWNRKQPQYELTKTECLYIATKFNDEARAKLVIRWEKLELKNQNWLHRRNSADSSNSATYEVTRGNKSINVSPEINN